MPSAPNGIAFPSGTDAPDFVAYMVNLLSGGAGLNYRGGLLNLMCDYCDNAADRDNKYAPATVAPGTVPSFVYLLNPGIWQRLAYNGTAYVWAPMPGAVVLNATVPISNGTGPLAVVNQQYGFTNGYTLAAVPYPTTLAVDFGCFTQATDPALTDQTDVGVLVNSAYKIRNRVSGVQSGTGAIEFGVGANTAVTVQGMTTKVTGSSTTTVIANDPSLAWLTVTQRAV